jgi:outer membrane usher protein FimD/PapC
MKHNLLTEDKLDLLKQEDQFREWHSLDDKRICILCEKTITGRQIEISGTKSRIRLHCPTEACNSTPREWVYPGNPLLSEKSWRDWLTALDAEAEENARRGQHAIDGAAA